MADNKILSIGNTQSIFLKSPQQDPENKKTQSQPQGGDDLGKKVYSIFQEKCYACHGGTYTKGNFRALDFSSYRSDVDRIDGKQPENSQVYDLIKDDQMPKSEYREISDIEKLTEEEKDTVLQWIAAGAPDPEGLKVEPQVTESPRAPVDIWCAIVEDLTNITNHDALLYTRYFSIDHLYAAGLSEQKLETVRQGLCKMINSASRGGTPLPLSPIDSKRLIFRIDLRDYGWTIADWQTILNRYPYDQRPPQQYSAIISGLTKIYNPVVRGDWFSKEASQAPLYDDLLKLPKTVLELERQLGLSTRNNIREGRALRAGFPGHDFPGGSGVSFNNRVIERHDSRFGYYWVSYDFAAEGRRQNIFLSPLGPSSLASSLPSVQSELVFDPAGGEFIFSLPNGFQGYMLANGKGEKLSTAPDTIVRDFEHPFRSTVVNPRSCISCHTNGMKRKSDRVLERFRVELPYGSPTLTNRFMQSLYGNPAELKARMEGDEKRYLLANTIAGIETQGAEPLITTVDEYDLPLSLTRAAAELGAPSDQLLRIFSDSTYSRYVENHGDIGKPFISRSSFEELYNRLLRTLDESQGITYLRSDTPRFYRHQAPYR